MEYLLAFILLALVLVALAWPLYRPGRRIQAGGDGSLDDLIAQRNGFYATLRDLDLDFQLGKLDANDYRAHRERYLERAASSLQQLDALSEQARGDVAQSNEIERQVAALRKNPPLRPLSSSEGNGKGAKLSTCPRCGQPYLPDDRFCRKCGQGLTG